MLEQHKKEILPAERVSPKWLFFKIKKRKIKETHWQRYDELDLTISLGTATMYCRTRETSVLQIVRLDEEVGSPISMFPL